MRQCQGVPCGCEFQVFIAAWPISKAMAKQRLFARDFEPRHLFLRIIQDLTGLHSRIWHKRRSRLKTYTQRIPKVIAGYPIP